MFKKCGSDNFQQRQKSIFDLLDAEEKNVKLGTPCNNLEPMQVDKHRAKKNRHKTRALRGQESIFKVPALPPLRGNMPDHRRNPSRWTKYSLADVAPSDMTEASNTAAALDFLRSRRKSPEREDLPTKVVFKRASHRKQCIEEDDDPEDKIRRNSVERIIGFGDPCPPLEDDTSSEKSIFKQSKLIMPEYVVGQKSAKAKKNKLDKPKHGKELALSHLLEEDNDE